MNAVQTEALLTALLASKVERDDLLIGIDRGLPGLGPSPLSAEMRLRWDLAAVREDWAAFTVWLANAQRLLGGVALAA